VELIWQRSGDPFRGKATESLSLHLLLFSRLVQGENPKTALPMAAMPDLIRV
jgi:hypothetical protein